MRRIRAPFCALAALLVASTAVRAQGGASDRSAGGDLEYALRDILYVWSAPLHGDAGDWGTALAVGVVSGAAVASDPAVHDWVHARRAEFPLKMLAWFGEDSPVNLYGRTTLLVPISALMYLGGLAFDSPGLRDAGIGCVSANLANTLSRRAVALVIGRSRPQERRGATDFRVANIDGSWEQRSFPAGHAANAMACTSFWVHRFDLGIAAPALYALAGGVGLARMFDEAHWLSDTVFGMSWGMSVGKAVAGRHDERAAREHVASPMPVVSLMWRLSF